MKFSAITITVGVLSLTVSTKAQFTAGQSCPADGAIFCSLSGDTWGMCDHGAVTDMGNVAAGMACVDGNMVAAGSATDQQTSLVAATALDQAILLQAFSILAQSGAGGLDLTTEQTLVKAAEFEMSILPQELVPDGAYSNGTVSTALPSGTAPPATAPAPIASTSAPALPPSVAPVASASPVPSAAPSNGTMNLVTVNIGGVARVMEVPAKRAIEQPKLHKRHTICVAVKIGGVKKYVCVS